MCAIVHKINYHNNEQCCIFTNPFLRRKHNNFEMLNIFFEKTVIYNHILELDESGNYSKENDNNIESALKKNRINIDECSEINALGPQLAFGAYLEEHDIPYIYWEEAAGLLSRKNILRDNESSNPPKQIYCDSKGLYDGSGKSVIKRVCNMNAQVEGFADPLAEHFDVSEELMKMPEEQREKVREFFTDVKSIDIPKDSVLFLTQHFANLWIMSFEDQALIYQLTADYFFEGQNLVFKPHPDDLMYYSLLFPDCKIIRERFPAEFLPFMFENKPKTIATISSTAVFNLRSSFDSIFSMDFKFQEDFHSVHRYYAAVLIAKSLGFDCSDVSLIGTDTELVKNLFTYVSSEKVEAAKKLYIVDDISQEDNLSCESIVDIASELPEDGIMIFINSRNDFCFYDMVHKGIWDYIVPMQISKKCIRDTEFFSDTDTEMIYFFSRSERLLNMAEKFEFSKELKYTGLNVSMDKLTPEQKQIKALEGILKATEKRLLYYMEKDIENKK